MLWQGCGRSGRELQLIRVKGLRHSWWLRIYWAPVPPCQGSRMDFSSAESPTHTGVSGSSSDRRLR